MDYTFYGPEDDHLFEEVVVGKVSVIPWNLIPPGRSFFFANSMRSKSAIKNDTRPDCPKKLKELGYRFKTKKCKLKETGEWGLKITRIDEN